MWHMKDWILIMNLRVGTICTTMIKTDTTLQIEISNKNDLE